MGIYQAYLAFTVLLCNYGMIMICLMANTLKDKVKKIAAYLYMGVIGVGFYFIVLKILLKIQGLELSTYQGVNNIPGKERNLVALIKDIYYDFFAFTIKGNILFTNIYSIIGFILLGLIFIMIIVQLCRKKHLFTSVWLYLVVLFIGISIPIGTNIVMVIAPENYHLLMRYQWILFPIIMIAFVDKYMDTSPWKEWGMIVAGILIVFNFIVINQVGYSNLEKKYEKTYAYCIRLLDRIEQTNGYYPGIPIAMIGVVSDQQFPTTDITHFVTRTMIGVSGDSLLYKGSDYQSFIQNYLGATLNILEPDVMETIYYDDIYLNMESFPQEVSVKYVEGMIYVKTENIENIGEGM